MNEILKNIKSNSKRYKNLKSKYEIGKINLWRNKFYNNAKFIIIQSSTRKFFVSSIPKWFYKIGIYSAIGGFIFFNYQKIQEEITKFNKKNFNERMKTYLNYLLTCSEIKEGGVELLDKIFKDKHSKESTVELLNELLEDEGVKEETKKYGVSLFNDLLKEEELKLEVKKLFLDILQMEEVRNEGVSILRYILEKEESKDIMAQYFKVIFLRSDIVKALSSVITDSAIYSMSTPTTKKRFAEFVIDVWSDANLRWYVIKKSLNFWEPAPTTVTKTSVEEDKINENLNNGQNAPPNDKPIREEITSLEMINKNNEKLNKI